METKRLTDKARAASKRAEELKNVPSMIRDRSSDLLQMANQLRDRPMPVVVTKPRRPLWKTAAMWFAGGMAIAAALGYFFDRPQGSLRRHMAYDKATCPDRAVFVRDPDRAAPGDHVVDLVLFMRTLTVD